MWRSLSTLRAATDPSVRGGEYYGPGGWNGFKAYPIRTTSSPRSYDATAQRGLWEKSERLTGVGYRITNSSPSSVSPPEATPMWPCAPPGRRPCR